MKVAFADQPVCQRADIFCTLMESLHQCGNEVIVFAREGEDTIQVFYNLLDKHILQGKHYDHVRVFHGPRGVEEEAEYCKTEEIALVYESDQVVIDAIVRKSPLTVIVQVY